LASYLNLSQWTSTNVAAAGKAASSSAITLSDPNPAPAGAIIPITPADDTPPIQSSADTTLTVTPVHEFDLDAWVAALDAAWARGRDLESVSRNLQLTLKQVVLERPDLADKSFDFKTRDGLIQVVSSDMSPDDRQWLQDQLNANGALLNATQNFHDHTVTNFIQNNKAFVGKALSTADVQAASDWADQQFSFMNLLSADVAQPLNSNYRQSPGDIVTDSAGRKVELTENPHTANGLISFMDKINEMQAGPIHYTSKKNGHVDRVLLNDPWEPAGWLAATYWPGSPDPTDP